MSNSLPRKIILIDGEDSRKFLQGLITQDIHKVDEQKHITPLYSALLNKQGRYNFDFFIIKIAHSSYLIDIHEELAKDLLKLFSFYKLLAKITYKVMPDLQVFASLDHHLYHQDAPQTLQVLSNFKAMLMAELLKHESLIFVDPRLKSMGYRIITPEKSLKNSLSNEEYSSLRYKNAIAEYPELIREKSIPMIYGFDELNALAYNKGCYLGQEFTHALKHKMTIRKRVVGIEINHSLSSNQQITLNGGESVAEIIVASDGYGLAILQMKYAKEQLFYNQKPIKLIIPQWITQFSLDT